MSRIVSVGTAVPPYTVTQQEAKQLCYGLFAGAVENLDVLIRVFDNVRIETRYISAPLEWFTQSHAFPEKNALYIEQACNLTAQAILRCLEPVGLTPADIDHLIFVSTTGVATPSIDARLINRLHMAPHVKRTPIWGLGCAGGVAGLARAAEYTQAFPESRVVLVAVELCTLTFLRQDLSKSNLVATSLFGDGAAAVLVVGEQTEWSGPQVVGAQSTIWPDSLDVMGWELIDSGLKVLFSKDIPAIVRASVHSIVEEFLSDYHLTLRDVPHYIAHPGGAKVIAAYQEALGLNEAQMRHTREVLRDYGNMSSPTVLFVLQRFLDQPDSHHGDYGLITALGPGFSSELMLLRW
ncbi:MAG: type III polyketide synthase [Candidatus Latescibacteria bacterium]|nr:type III polyketide synthase [Candidatus Latescibacterota bacterium]